MSSNPDACPHCGGDNGFYTKSLVKFQCNYDWGGDSTGSETGDQVRGGNAYYCFDCDRNITSHIKRAEHVNPYTGER